MAPGKLPPPPGQPGFGHEEETEAVSANDAALQRGSHFPARHWPLGSLQGEAPGEARRALRTAGRSCGVFLGGGLGAAGGSARAAGGTDGAKGESCGRGNSPSG